MVSLNFNSRGQGFTKSTVIHVQDRHIDVNHVTKPQKKREREPPISI